MSPPLPQSNEYLQLCPLIKHQNIKPLSFLWFHKSMQIHKLTIERGKFQNHIAICGGKQLFQGTQT